LPRPTRAYPTLIAPFCFAIALVLGVASAEAQPRSPAAGTSRPAATRAAAPSGDVVQAIEVQGNQRIEADTVRSYMLLQPGDRFDAERLDRSLKTLFATGLFRDVQVRRDGARVIVDVVENPIVNRVAFEGNRKISDDVLRGEVQMRPRSVYTQQAVQADRQRILELYARRGRFAAVVDPKIIELDQNRVDVVYEIQEGSAALVARINFIGNEHYSDSRLKEVVATKEQAWYRLFSSSDQFDPERLAFDRELLRRFYLRNGYADVQVTGATAELSPERDAFFITYTIDEGMRYRVGDLDIVSNVRNLEAAPCAATSSSRAATGTTATWWSARPRRCRTRRTCRASPSSRCSRASAATASSAWSTSPLRSTSRRASTSSASTSSATPARRTASSAASSGWPRATPSTPRRSGARATASATSATSRTCRWRPRRARRRTARS
jgi:outer membrane translocation and assembly module TamA